MEKARNAMGFISWLKWLVGITPKSPSSRLGRTKAQADRAGRIEKRNNDIGRVKLMQDKKSRDRFMK
jgi:hypothetical protein